MAVHTLLKGCSILLILYGICVMAIRSGSRFYLVWYLSGLFFLILSEALRTGLWKKMPGPVLISLSALVLATVLLFIIITAKILGCFHQKPSQDSEYLIVLGAQVKSSGPSQVLKYRLDAAAEYADRHPSTKIIVSGGQGSNEPDTEAKIMKDYLLENYPKLSPDQSRELGQGSGLDQSRERIILEDQSLTTDQNIRNTLLITGDLPVTIVTNNFHLYRAMRIAEKNGYSKVSGLAAPSNPFYLPNNMLREILAVIKYKITGRI